MSRIFFHLIISALALLLVERIIKGVYFDGLVSLINAAVGLGFLNVYLRPLLIRLTLPLSLYTLGIFTLIINGFVFFLASIIVPGFHVAGFWSAFLASILFSFVSFIAGASFAPIRFMSFSKNSTLKNPVHIDGVIDVEGKVEE